MKLLNLIGIATYGIGKILGQSAPILLLMILSRFVPIEELGFLSFIIAIIAIFSSLSDFGLSDSQNKFLADDISLVGPLVNWEVLLTIMVGLVLWIIDYFTKIFKGYGFLLFLVTLGSSFNILVSLFSGLLKFVESGIYQLIASGVYIVATLYFFFVRHIAVVESLVIARIISWYTISVWMFLKAYWQGYYKWSWKMPKTVWIFALNAFWFSLVELIITQADVVFVDILLGDRFAGIFKPASLLGVAPMVLGTLFSAPLLAILARKQKASVKLAWILTAKVVLLLAFIVLIVFLITCFFANDIISLIFTKIIAEEGQWVFIFMLASTCFYVIGMPLQDYFLANGNSKFVGRVASLKLLLFILTIFPVIYFYGVIGVSAAHLVIYFLSFFLYSIKFLSYKINLNFA